MKKIILAVFFLLSFNGFFIFNSQASATAVKSFYQAAVLADCGECNGNKLTNGNFENGTSGWIASKGTSLQSTTSYKACGARGAMFSGAGNFYQDVTDINVGDEVTLTIYGARHEKYNQKFQLQFLNSSGKAIESASQSTDINKVVTAYPQGLKLYTISGIVPVGAVKVRVMGSQTHNNGWIKVDAACLTVIPAIDCNCDGNKIVDGSFEDGSTNWIKNESQTNFTIENAGKGCGSKYGVIKGAGSIYQDIALVAGSIVNLNIWGGATEAIGNQKFKVSFLDINNQVINAEERVMNFILDNNRLKEFVFTGLVAPALSVKVRVEALSAVGTSAGISFKVDGTCLQIVPSKDPLPVTLVNFNVKKENETARLTWSTSAEMNTKEFEIEHSENGKNWNHIGSLAAQGESGELIQYHYIHPNPIKGTNYYRLKMIDLDFTSSLSRMIYLNFDAFSDAGEIVVFPNPTSDYVQLSSDLVGKVDIQMFDMRGMKVLSMHVDAGAFIDLSRLPAGAYMFQLRQGDGTSFTKRIQVVK